MTTPMSGPLAAAAVAVAWSSPRQGSSRAAPRRKTPVYATADYHSWQRTTNVVLDYPIPGHQDRFRIPRMNAIGFSAQAGE